MKYSGLFLLTICVGFYSNSVIGQKQPATAPTTAPDSQLSDTFPQTIEVLPGRLRATVFLHEIKNGHQKISCWTYVTDGLLAKKQKEISFTLQRNEHQKAEDYPSDPFRLFAAIYHYAELGTLVDVGELTLLGESKFLGHEDFRGIGYVAPEPMPGVDTGHVPLLAGIMLKGEEGKVAYEYGLTRVTALLGRKYHYYPVPLWSDLEREPVTSLTAMQSSALAKVKIPRLSTHASYYQEGNNIYLSIAPADQARMRDALGKLQLTQPMLISANVDPHANACLVWSPGQSNAEAITPPNSDGSRRTGGYLIFVPEQSETRSMIVEDGVSLFLTNSDWQKVREALSSGKDLVLPANGKGGTSLYIQWLNTIYTSPVTGEGFSVQGGWRTYWPENPSPTRKGVAVSAENVVLLTGQDAVTQRTSAKDLAGYLEKIDQTADGFFGPQKDRIARKIGIRFDLTETGHEIILTSKPELAPVDAVELHRRLDGVGAPKVKGPVEFEYFFQVAASAHE